MPDPALLQSALPPMHEWSPQPGKVGLQGTSSAGLLGLGKANQFAATPLAALKPKPAGRLPAVALPPHAVFKEATPMLSKYKGEETGSIWGTKVKYLNNAERQAYKLTFNPQDQRFYSLNPATGKQERFDTEDASSAFGGGEGKAIFVVDPVDGSIYASKHQAPGKFHHSSLLGLDPETGMARQVAMAGELSMKDGQLVGEISRRSGHFQPPEEAADRFVNHLDSIGVPRTFQVGSGF